jgi:hypothetical protein
MPTRHYLRQPLPMLPPIIRLFSLRHAISRQPPFRDIRHDISPLMLSAAATPLRLLALRHFRVPPPLRRAAADDFRHAA